MSNDFCDGSGRIGYGGRVYPSSRAAFRYYRDCAGVMCHPVAPVQSIEVEEVGRDE